MIVRDVFAHRHHLPPMRQSATLRTAVGVTLVATRLVLWLRPRAGQRDPRGSHGHSPLARVMEPLARWHAARRHRMTLGSGYAWAPVCPVSMDPPATHGELPKLVTYAAAAILGVLLYLVQAALAG